MQRATGLIGIGLMGSAIAANLLRAGYRVIGYDILSARIQSLRQMGGNGAGSSREVADSADIVITSLPSAESLDNVVYAQDGLLFSKNKDLIVIETSTLPLDAKARAKKALSQIGRSILDCPLSGTARQAALRDLAVYASGDPQACEACKPVLESFSRSYHYLGEFGMGSKMKFIANLLVAIHNVSAAEAFVLGMKAGLDPEMIYKVISDGAGSSRMFEVRGPMMMKDNYDKATMRVDLFQKDIDIIHAFANNIQCPTPLFAAAQQIYMTASAGGRKEQDTASVCAVLQEMAGLKRK